MAVSARMPFLRTARTPLDRNATGEPKGSTSTMSKRCRCSNDSRRSRLTVTTSATPFASAFRAQRATARGLASFSTTSRGGGPSTA